jgi:hypothetical protein
LHPIRHPFARALTALGLCAATALPVQANLLTNGSFDAAGPNLAGTGSYCYLGIGDYRECGSVPGWTGTLQIIAASSFDWHTPSGNGGWTAAQGSRLAGLQNSSYLAQTLALAGGSYTLSWLDSNRKSLSYSGNSYQVLLDGTVLDTFATSPGDAWAGNSLSFSTTAGSHTLRLQGLRASGDGTSFIDAMSLDAVAAQVPEPQSLALVALALAGVGLTLRSKAR